VSVPRSLAWCGLKDNLNGCYQPAHSKHTNPARESKSPVLTMGMVHSWAQTLNLNPLPALRQPITSEVIAGQPPVIAYTNPASTQKYATNIGGTNISLMAIPVAYKWEWGDGDKTTTHTPGAKYPHETITHAYQPAKRRQIKLTVTYDAYLSIAASPYRLLPFTLQTNSVSTPFKVLKVGIVLTDNTEKQPHH
ncbi:MAG: hypothetical protein Q4A71_03165, partial [Actinomycetaceae bacterium]|nr:hypothetical protein [Actinomycetaceae bacterium]